MDTSNTQPAAQTNSPPVAPNQIKTYTYLKQYITKTGEIRYCTQTIKTKVSGKKPGRPKKNTTQ